VRRIAKKQQPFFVIPVTSQVSVPVFRPSGAKYDPSTQPFYEPYGHPTNEAGLVQTSRYREQAGILGTHPSARFNLGALGYLDSEVIAAIQMDYRNFMSIQAYTRLGNSDITENQLLHDIQDAFYMPLFGRIRTLINSLAPKDSGRLRNAMELAAGGGTHGGTGAAGGGATSQIGTLNPFAVIINTGKVYYAPVVNKMPDNWLQHFGGPHRGYSGQSKRVGRRVKQSPHSLNDPQAIQYWYQEIVNGSRQFAQQLWMGLRAAGPLIRDLTPAANYLSTPTQTRKVVVYYNPTDLVDALFAVRFS